MLHFFQNAVKYGLYCKLRQVRFLLRLTLVARHQPSDERLIVVSQLAVSVCQVRHKSCSDTASTGR